MKRQNVALGFYHEMSTAAAVCAHLKKEGFSRFAIIKRDESNGFKVNRNFPIVARAMPLMLAVAGIFLAFIGYFGFALGFIAISALLYWLACRLELISWDVINRFKTKLIRDEILILVQIGQAEVRDVLSVLRDVKGGHPVTFLLRPAMFEEENVIIPKEPLSLEQMCEEASKLANTLAQTGIGKIYNQSLLRKFHKNDYMLQFLRRDIADAEYIEQGIPAPAEWLLDNMYVIESAIEDIKLNLPKKFYKELPKILHGEMKGLPRIYALAIEFIEDSVGQLNTENITQFLKCYQTDHPLSIGELWAFPLMLRLRLVEWVEFLIVRVDNRMRSGELANFWGNRLLSASRYDMERLNPFLIDLSKAGIPITGHFAEVLLDHLFDQEAVLPEVRKWLEERFQMPLDEILHQEHLNESTEHIVFSDCIKSLITLGQLAWPEIFETVSPVDAIFKADPAGVYTKMDFTTRNSYRKVIEEVAKRIHAEEVLVAKQVVDLANKGAKSFERHIGYYLIDQGRPSLEQKLHLSPKIIEKIRRLMINHAALVYVGGIGLITLIASAFSLSYGGLIFTALALLPLSEIAVQSINYLFTLILPPLLLPKMSFKSGLPEECKTLVVVPMILKNKAAIIDAIEQLEIRYLANIDPQLKFSLFTDYSDANEKNVEDDAPLLDLALKEIQKLETTYEKGKFFLFHRERKWSNSEKAWIGWERKRGKLETLNQYLSGETTLENILYSGNAADLKNIRYVITLDADTQLPKDQGKALIETLSHPLNSPFLTKDKTRLERGFTIIQPRVATDFLQGKASLFCKIFAEPEAVDPYTLAISNIYQDLAKEGTYHGKGIYDVQAFHTLLAHHFPEEHLLSHDLLEGAFTGVGFACNICLYDVYPKDFLTWIKRQHRWIRGDWQIVDWLFPKVPINEGKYEQNPLSILSRWKIFDNLRRALSPISLLLLLVIGWFSSHAEAATGLVLFVFALPLISLLIGRKWNKPLSVDIKTTFYRFMISIMLLPAVAYNSLDALFRFIFRRKVSHHNLLQWNSGNEFSLNIVWVAVFAFLALCAIVWLHPITAWLALPFCLTWFFSPFIVRFLEKPLDKALIDQISIEDQQLLRKIGRRTWRYFDELIGAKTHFLPPDNYQTDLTIEIADRTSPTNIGMWLLTLLSARDFNYITCDVLIDRTLSTIQELKKMERYEGHFLNWYQIQTLKPLMPRYVSTVDSGNLLACFWTLKPGIEEVQEAPIIPKQALSGLQDTYEVLKEHKRDLNIAIPSTWSNLQNFYKTIQSLLTLTGEEHYWEAQIKEEIASWNSILSRYFSWVEPLSHLEIMDPDAKKWKMEALSWNPSLRDLSEGNFPPALIKLIEATKKSDIGRAIQEALNRAQWFAGEKIGLANEIIESLDQFSTEMNLKFLYNTDRRLFSIGYNIDEKRLDSSHYDLLASEARITSLVAIAKEEAPLDHWWALGRPYNQVQGEKVLLSWGGTMFEYLMPLIFNEQHPESLIGQGCFAAVARQINYGKRRGIPWGISESAYSAIDSHKIYQYKSFGVPGLGIKRDLEDDLVISPYSTVLALPVSLKASIKNLKNLAEKNLLGPYGFYDSMDFTRQSTPTGERGVLVSVYMAHHQGMIFSVLNNVLNQNAIIRRFHKDPRISGINPILYERIPQGPFFKTALGRKEPLLRKLLPFSITPIMGQMETPESAMPKVNVLSNGNYSLMVTNSGGGYSRLGDIDIYRWRSDTTSDSWGSFFYIKDCKSEKFWSAAFQPTQTKGSDYSVNFRGDKAEFRRRDDEIETLTEIVVSPEDNAEIRQMTLINHSSEIRHIELTSYLELVLAPHAADIAHPCFNKLFIEIEPLLEHSALLAQKRNASPDNPPLFVTHLVTTNEKEIEPVQFETDRGRFIGRGNSATSPLAMQGELSNKISTSLDPIFSLRIKFAIEPGRRVQLSFVTATSESREGALALMEKYKNITASQRGLEFAWNFAQLELRRFRIEPEEVQLFQKLASRILYPHAQLRASEERLLKNQAGQSHLWAQGISGDLPILVVTAGDTYELELVKQVLIAHSFLNMRGLKTDLILLDEEEAGYMQPVQEQLQNMIKSYSSSVAVHLRSTKQMHPDELNAIICAASVVLISSRGSLRQQLVSPQAHTALPPKLRTNPQIQESLSEPLPFLELPYFNGLGGYSQDGKSYAIYLGPGTKTPAPWINVLANEHFGTLVSESGIGCSWYGNSQTNRLTPWSNDPLLDPITDTVYLRDEQIGTYWTITPGPVRELDPYRVRHGQGYSRFEHNSHGIIQEMTVFVPQNAEGGLAARIQHIRLINHSPNKRILSLTAYSEWVLGKNKENDQMHIVTEWDSENKALLAYNRFNPDFGSHTAFTFTTSDVASFTADRAEFLGRNRSQINPEALKRASLSNRVGGALDPCSALQVKIEIEPGKEAEVCFIMGYAATLTEVKSLILKLNKIDKIKHYFLETQGWWDKTLGTLQIEIPDLATQFSMNSWLLYQTISCRFFARTAFYQSSGAFGYRDQLQDVMAMVYTLPAIARAHILKAASRQYVEGDVQHWWHPQTGAGIRTRCSDDLLWLPFVTAHYIKVTQDKSILTEPIPFLEGDKLADDQDELFQIPTVSNESASLLEHCRRAINKGKTAGPHGLPLIGSCDWNDGMNKVGIKGKGESVWLGWFLVHVLQDFAELDTESYQLDANRLAKIIDETAWDGEWYRRAYYDDGTPIGSILNMEAYIDSIAQSWAVLTGAGDKNRSIQALNSANEHLVKTKERLLLLLTPPFNKTSLNPGYIKAYPPGIRENGGQYTHGSAWLPMAFARLKEGDKAVELLRMLFPTSHTSTPEENERYKVEPYAIAADVYSHKDHMGRGGWTWYTGSSAWLYRIWLEEILGFKLRGNELTLEGSIPKEWEQYTIRYQYKSSSYEITVKNPHHLNWGTQEVLLDGQPLSSSLIHLQDDGLLHKLEIKLLP